MADPRPIYFDNAATSWPKPPAVQAAMVHFLQEVGGSPGRAGHRMSIAASRIVSDTRDLLAQLFNLDDPGRIAFTKNSTEALNIAIHGWCRPGDHVITSSMEHNSVMRPLRALEAAGLIELSVAPCSPTTGDLDPADLAAALRPNTRLVAVVHASNVVGNVLPLQDLIGVAHGAGVPVLMDASQTAGALPLDVSALGVDLLAFTGHKSLLGPTGTGGLIVGEGIELRPLMYGGTGSRSELEYQPDFMPDRYESGTLNVVGIAGLGAAVQYLLARTVEAIHEHELTLVKRFLEQAGEQPGIQVYGSPDVSRRIGVLSFNLAGISPSRVGLLLDRGFGVMTRIGLHCAPAAHKTIGTFDEGTVRFGFSCFNTIEEVDATLMALRQIQHEFAYA